MSSAEPRDVREIEPATPAEIARMSDREIEIRTEQFVTQRIIDGFDEEDARAEAAFVYGGPDDIGIEV